MAATGNDGAIGLTAPANCNGVIAVTAHTINGENADYANIGAAGSVGAQPSISSPGGGTPTVLGAGGPTDDANWFGYYIWSTILFGNTTPSSAGGASGTSTGPAYSGFTGTSAATPQVAAVAALIKSMIPSVTPAQTRSFIVNNVRPHPAGGTCASGGGLAGQCGPGLLDANLAVRAAALVAPPIVFGSRRVRPWWKARPARLRLTSSAPDLLRISGFATVFRSPVRLASSYTTPAVTVAADNGAIIAVVITNPVGTASSAAATLAVTAPAPQPPAGGGAPPPTGGGGGGGSAPLWQLVLLAA